MTAERAPGGGPLISVVVPFFNNAGLLGQCLASIAAQTLTDLQVVMVDDGSTDESAAVAREMAAADPRFTLISVSNGGPGWARNHGVAAATGEYLAFADADDVVPPHAYATLLRVLERSGSDFACGSVLRLTGAGIGPSGLHDRAIKARRVGTHISAAPALFYDISVFNKLFRRSFWEAAGLRFPEGMVWEDLVAMTRAHVLATAVDVITDPVYHWRDRDVGARSITQSRTDIANFRDRITALTMIDDFLRTRREASERSRDGSALLRRHQHKALLNDLWLYVRDLPEAGEVYLGEFTSLAAGYLRTVLPTVRRHLPATRKLAYHLIEHGRAAELAGFAVWLAAHQARTPPMVRTPRGRRADLPYRRDRALAIPDRVYRPHWRELDPEVRVDSITWSGDKLVIEGSAYVPSVDIAKRRNASKVVLFQPRGRWGRPLVKASTTSVHRPDVTGASDQDRYRYDWAGFRSEVPAAAFQPASQPRAADWDCYILVRGRWTWRAARLHTPGPAAEHPEARPVNPGLILGPYWAGRRLRIGLRPEPGQRPAGPARRDGDERRGPAERDGPSCRLTQSWSADGALVLRGTMATGGDLRVVLAQLDGPGRRDFPVDTSHDRFTASIPVGAVEVFGDRQPLRDGRWAVRLRRGDQRIRVALAEHDERPVIIGRKVFGCAGTGAGLELTVGPALGLAERGRVRRRLLRDAWYRAQRRLPVRDSVLFMSYAGRQGGDSPRAIADELRRRGDRREHFWAVADWSVPTPEGGRAVLVGTAAYYAALARSRYLIVNDHMPQPYRKRRGQRHVQTWHGTPLKRIGLDIGEPKSAAGRRYLDFMKADVAQWDLLLSPNPYSTRIMRRAFAFGGEIAETGYPRNDALHGARARADAISRRLGLPEGKRVAMYVPTWRDDQHDAAGRYRLDLRVDLAAAQARLGADYVLLIRGHHLMAEALGAGAPTAFCLDVTDYPDISELLAVTDVLITDYSSVMFDFAPTGRPMLFFTYDLERYRDEVRGFYFDFAARAPGPLLATSDEVIAALADLDSVAAAHEAARAAFAAEFCPLDDGKAAARACDRILGG